MKNALAFLSLSALLTFPVMGQAKVLSLSDWKTETRRVLETGDEKAFSRLMDSDRLTKGILSNSNSDRKTMEKARALFTNGKLAEALKEYDKVPKDSDFWLQASEEKGWTLHRMQSFEKALAQTKTLLSPVLAPIVGSEPFFLRALTGLKICDYKDVLETNSLFKETQRERVVTLQNVAKDGQSAAMDRVLARVSKLPLSIEETGPEAKELPRLFYRDREMQKAVISVKIAEAARELRDAKAKTAKMDSLRTKLISKLEAKESKAKKSIRSRLQALAKVETAENSRMIQKLNLIEVEVIGRIHSDSELSKDQFSKGQFRKVGMNDMVFPDDGHPWMDELDWFEVKADACPRGLRRKM